MRTLKKVLCLSLALLLLAVLFTACGEKAPDPVNTNTCSYEEMVAYLTAKGYIAKDAAPVDINTTEGYVTDNTGGEIPYAAMADKAEDFGGLWLFHWEKDSEAYNNVFVNAPANGNMLVYMGGACVLQAEAINGLYAVAFAEGYAQKDAVLADFNALPNK
ncbi:MAG: hypothetical protein IKQ54_01950 [Oscillospiraceae bacterium]|jgi:hypothetical protein|nr:hypothetical protein [Oscillospiraceae bacterium]